MTGFDVAAWIDFGVAVAGGSAAMAGQLFVAVSLNVKDIVGVPGLAARAGTNLALLITILLVAVYLVTPEQHYRFGAVVPIVVQAHHPRRQAAIDTRLTVR